MLPKSAVKNLFDRSIAIIRPSVWVLFGLRGLSTIVVISILWSLPKDAAHYLGEQPAGMVLLNAILYAITLTVVVGLPLLLKQAAERKISGVRELLGIVKRLRLRDALLVVPVWAMYFASTLVAVGIASQIPGFNAEQTQDVGFKDLTTQIDLVLAFVGLVVLAPIAEELLFRGYLFGKIRAANNFWVSAIATSVVFGFAHLQWNIGVDTFVLSLFLCWLREKTGSIWAGMLLHGLKNAIAYTFLFILGVQ